jgi:hypothetical protein
MKLIYNAANILEAEIVSGMLDANGIASHVGGYYLQGGIGEAAVSDFATVYVADNDVEAARSVIKEYETAE